MRSTLYWTLLIILISLALSTQNLLALASQNQELTNSEQLPLSKGKEQQKKNNRDTEKSESPQPNPPQIPVTIEGPVTIIKQLSAMEQESEAQKQAEHIWDKALNGLIFDPSQWPNIGLLVLAGVAAYFTWGAYCAARRQANAAEETLKLSTIPRLHIDGVRAEPFEIERAPIFFVRIVNSGPATAEEVTVVIRVEPTVHYGGAKYSDGAHKFAIPANSFREEFISVTQPLTAELIDSLNRQTWQLCITGYFEHAGKRTKYCYRYNPFPNPRPEGLPQFIPCDYDTRRTLIMIAGSPPLSAIQSAQGNMIPSGGIPVE